MNIFRAASVMFCGGLLLATLPVVKAALLDDPRVVQLAVQSKIDTISGSPSLTLEITDEVTARVFNNTTYGLADSPRLIALVPRLSSYE